MNKVIKSPVRLDHNTVVVLHVFSRHDILEDLWMIDSADYMKEDYEGIEKSAQELMDQLYPYMSVAQLQAFRKAINTCIANHNHKFGTKFK